MENRIEEINHGADKSNSLEDDTPVDGFNFAAFQRCDNYSLH